MTTFRPEKIITRLLTNGKSGLESIVGVQASNITQDQFWKQHDAYINEWAEKNNYTLYEPPGKQVYHLSDASGYQATVVPWSVSSFTKRKDEHATRELGNHRDYAAALNVVTHYQCAWEFKNQNNKRGIVELAKKLKKFHDDKTLPAGSGRIHNLR